MRMRNVNLEPGFYEVETKFGCFQIFYTLKGEWACLPCWYHNYQFPEKKFPFSGVMFDSFEEAKISLEKWAQKDTNHTED